MSVPAPFPSCVSPTASNAWRCGSWRSITMTFPSTTLPSSTCPSPSWPRKCLASRCIPSERVSGPAPQPSSSSPPGRNPNHLRPASLVPLLPLLSPFLGPCPRLFCSVLRLDSRWLVLAADPPCCPSRPRCVPPAWLLCVCSSALVLSPRLSELQNLLPWRGTRAEPLPPGPPCLLRVSPRSGHQGWEEEVRLGVVTASSEVSDRCLQTSCSERLGHEPK